MALLRDVTFTLLASALSLSAWAASGPSCERFVINKLSPGMRHNQVRLKMGGEGIQSVTRTSGSRETSAADYPGPALDVYVEYDHPINRRPTARAVLVRASMPLLPTNVEELVTRFGAPDTGADDLSDGVLEGVAVWVNEPCGVVLTAYRPQGSWWATEGRTTLQLETLAMARQGDSPASSSLSAILERKHGPPAAISLAADLPSVSEILSPVMELFSDSVEANGSPAADLPPVSEPPPPVREPIAEPVEPAKPLTIATWHPQVSTGSAPTAAPKSTVPAEPLTIATWRPQVAADVAPPLPPKPRASAAPPSSDTLHPQRPADVAPAMPPDKPAERITYVPPVCPRTARWLGMAGHVTLAIVVKDDGRVTRTPRVVAENPTGQGFAEAAIEAVRTWSFSPAVQDGYPVKSTLTIDVEFKPQEN